MNYLIEEFEMMAAEAKAHLERYPMAICEMRIEKEHLDLAKATVLDIVGEKIFRRINFFEKRGDA